MCILSILPPPPPPFFVSHFPVNTDVIVLWRQDRLYTSIYSYQVISRSGGNSPIGQFSFIYFPALISGHPFDLGHLRGILIFATINLIACTNKASLLQKQTSDCRCTALGVIVFTSSIGGTVFPVVFRNLLVTVRYVRIKNLRLHHSSKIPCSFKWTMASTLILAMGVTHSVCISRPTEYMCEYALMRSQTIKRRLPPTTVSGGLSSAKQFRSPADTVYTASGFFALLNLYTC